MKNKKIKILAFSNKNIFYFDGAYSNRFRSIYENLAKNNVEIHLIITHGYFELEEYIFHKKYSYPNNIIVHYVGIPFQIRILNFFKLNKLINYLILHKQKYLLKIYDFKFGWLNFGLETSFYLKSIFLFEKYNIKLIQEINEFPRLFSTKKNFNSYIKLILPKIDIMLLMTNDLLNYFRLFKNLNTKLYHIPMTVDLSRFNIIKSLKNKKFTFAYVGLMNNKKDGVDILIKAFNKVVKINSNVHLKLIGPTLPEIDFKEQQKFIFNNKLLENVEYTGKVSRKCIPEMLVNADCLVLARPDSKQAQFGFPTKLGEYLATGNPVIVTSVGEITFYLKDMQSAFIAKPNDIDDLVSKILYVINHRTEAKKIGQNGKKVAFENFNSEVQSKKIMEILKNNLNL